MNLIQSHTVLLKDKVRIDAYKKAIEATVHEGDLVVDIGCGLGILSFLALKAGARFVHAIEVEPTTIALVKDIAKLNGFDKKIAFHKGLSPMVKLKERADVIVSELFGNLGTNENLISVMADAKNRFLKDGGRMIPSSIKVFVAPCEQPDWQHTSMLLHNFHGLDMLPDSPKVDLGTPSVDIKYSHLLSHAKVFEDISFERPSAQALEHSEVENNNLIFEIERDGILTGFAGWFESKLADNVMLANPPEGLTTHWRQGFLPLRVPHPVRKGNQLKLWLEIVPNVSGLSSGISYNYEVIK